MTTSAVRSEPVGVDARLDDLALHVRLSDGREIAVPLEWFPGFANATREARENWRWIGGGTGHWPDLDEDLSIRPHVDSHKIIPRFSPHARTLYLGGHSKTEHSARSGALVTKKGEVTSCRRLQPRPAR
jgi:hypothetical protein